MTKHTVINIHHLVLLSYESLGVMIVVKKEQRADDLHLVTYSMYHVCTIVQRMASTLMK